MNSSPHEGDSGSGGNRGTNPADDHARPDPRGGGVGGLFVGLGAICDTAAKLTGVDGAAVAVLTIQQAVRELVYATDARAQQIDEVQFTLGEGPCLDAYRRNEPQLYPCLDDTALQRWPGFTAEVIGLGVAAVFAFPVPGARRPLGVLELYRRTAGELRDSERESAQLCASALRIALQSNWRAVLLRSSSEEAAIDTAAVDGSASPPSDPFTRSQVHVAAGMVAVQLSISATEGLDRLRAYSYAENRSVLEVAADIVARRLSFRDRDDSGMGS